MKESSKKLLFPKIQTVIAAAETLAGGFLAAIVLLTFVSVVLRYAFAWTIPDSYDIGRLLMGIVIFWGIAVTSYRGEHITVELIYNLLPRRARHALDLLGTLFTLGCMTVFAWAMAGKVADTIASNEATYDLRTPVWPFYALACAGLIGSVPLLLLRLFRQLRTGSADPPPPVLPTH